MVISKGATSNDKSIRNHVFGSLNALIFLLKYGIDHYRPHRCLEGKLTFWIYVRSPNFESIAPSEAVWGPGFHFLDNILIQKISK